LLFWLWTEMNLKSVYKIRLGDISIITNNKWMSQYIYCCTATAVFISIISQLKRNKFQFIFWIQVLKLSQLWILS
jgi:hypothetical protein